jgi:hypothetical protein
MIIRNEDFDTIEEKVEFINKMNKKKMELYNVLDKMIKPIFETAGFEYNDHYFQKENNGSIIKLGYTLNLVNKELTNWNISPFLTLEQKKTNDN